MAANQNSALRLPQQDLERCSMFETNRDAVAAWADQLPMGSPARAGTELRAACAELNRVPLAPELRFQLLGDQLLHVVGINAGEECRNHKLPDDDGWIFLTGEVEEQLHPQQDDPEDEDHGQPVIIQRETCDERHLFSPPIVLVQAPAEPPERTMRSGSMFQSCAFERMYWMQ